MKVVLDEKFWMKSDSFIPIWMKVYLTQHTHDNITKMDWPKFDWPTN